MLINIPNAIVCRSPVPAGFEVRYYSSPAWASRNRGPQNYAYWPKPPFKHYKGSDNFMWGRYKRTGWTWFPSLRHTKKR